VPKLVLLSKKNAQQVSLPAPLVMVRTSDYHQQAEASTLGVHFHITTLGKLFTDESFCYQAV